VQSGHILVTRIDGSSGPPRSRGAPSKEKVEAKKKKKDEKAKDDPNGGKAGPGAPLPLHHSPYGPPALTGPPPPLVGVAPRPSGVSLRQLSSVSVPHFDVGGGIQIGMAVRKGQPHLVLVDAGGAASLVAVDPETGRLGADEELAPLSSLAASGSAKCAPSPDDARAIVSVLHHVGVEPGSLPGVIQPGTIGFAVLRWSKSRVCLDAMDVSVRDDRYEPDYVQAYENASNLRKLAVKSDGKGGLAGALLVIAPGMEVRQKVTCK